MHISTFFSLFFGLWQLVEAQLTPWDNIIFFFGWEPYDPTIVRCSTIPIAWDGKRGADPEMTSPFSIYILYAGYQPLLIRTEPTTGYNWTVGLPVGGPYILTMKDANGFTGGTSLVFQVTEPPNAVTCDPPTFVPNNLTTTITSTFAECSGLTVMAQGGTAPYTMQIMVSQRPPKTTTWTTSTMSYTIDLQPSEQFFVLVKDATGKTALNGLYTVGTGDTGCYELATTVVVGNLSTTLSYDPTSTVSFPSGITSTSLASGATVLQNTDSTTVTSVVTFHDGSSSTYTLGPGASITVNDDTHGPSNEKKDNLPAIVGGAAGGAALLVLILLILFILKRRSREQKRMQDQREAYDRRRLSDPPMAGGSQPVLPHSTPGRESAPLMAHVDSAYSATTPSVTSPGSMPSAGYFPNTVTSNTTHTPWTIPDHITPQTSPNPVQSPITSNSEGSRRPSISVSMNTPGGSDTGLPPGAMAPRRIGGSSVASSQGIKSPTLSVKNAVGQEGQPEKATFIPSPAIPAPPPYTAADRYRA